MSSTGTSSAIEGFIGGYGYLQTYGLEMVGRRLYDPVAGRFLTRDPARSGRNWFTYCENRPTVEIDPSGLQSIYSPAGSAMAAGCYYTMEHPDAPEEIVPLVEEAVDHSESLWEEAIEFIQKLVNKANQEVTKGGDRPWLEGIYKHREVQGLAEREGRLGDAEQSYLGGDRWGKYFGPSGSIRIDGTLFDKENNPVAIVDFKFGNAQLSMSRCNDIWANVVKELKHLPIVQISPDRDPVVFTSPTQGGSIPVIFPD